MSQILTKQVASTPQITFKLKDKKLTVEIETERLYIKSYSSKDFEDCVKLYGDPAVTKYFDHGIPRTKKEVENLIEDRGYKYFDNGEPFGLFSLFLKKNSHFIGQADLFPTDEPNTVEVGCILQKNFQHQGLGTEVVKTLIIDYIQEINNGKFNHSCLPILRVLGTVHPKNTASNKLVRKCDMKVSKFQERFGNPRIWYYYNVGPVHSTKKRCI